MNSASSIPGLGPDSEEYFFDIAVQDASSCLEVAQQSGLARDRRSAVRAVFAFIDGCHEFVRNQVRDQASLYSHSYSVSELAVLREESPYVDERGNVKVRPLRVPLVTSIKALVKLLEKNSAAAHKVDLAHPGFAALSRALVIRNRVVHPKGSKDLEVSPPEMEDVRKAFAWYLSFALRMSHATNEVLVVLADKYGVKPTLN
jgi:hypothetical protein